jgi:hypothetical protein
MSNVPLTCTPPLLDGRVLAGRLTRQAIRAYWLLAIAAPLSGPTLQAGLTGLLAKRFLECGMVCIASSYRTSALLVPFQVVMASHFLLLTNAGFDLLFVQHYIGQGCKRSAAVRCQKKIRSYRVTGLPHLKW